MVMVMMVVARSTSPCCHVLRQRHCRGKNVPSVIFSTCHVGGGWTEVAGPSIVHSVPIKAPGLLSVWLRLLAIDCRGAKRSALGLLRGCTRHCHGRQCTHLMQRRQFYRMTPPIRKFTAGEVSRCGMGLHCIIGAILQCAWGTHIQTREVHPLLR